MNLVSVKVANFRSVNSLLLDDCGSFNVLIGKNNSGKSTILSSIQTFFSCVALGNPVALNLRIGKGLDFHKANTNTPIGIEAKFKLSQEERDSLVTSIVKEANQLKNAANALPENLNLNISLAILAWKTGKYAYVNEISVQDREMEDVNQKHILLSMGEKTAKELALRHKSHASVSTQVAYLKALAGRLDADDWEKYRQEVSGERRPRSESASNIPLRYYIRHITSAADLDESMVVEFTNILRDEKTYQDFNNAIDSLVRGKLEEQESIIHQALKNPLSTFAGQDTQLPGYAIELLNKVSRIKVHYLTDRRAAIGKEEAERLLNLKTRRGGLRELQNIQDVVSSLLGVKIDAFQAESLAETQGKNSQSTAELDVDEFLVEANGSGIKEALRLILDIEFSHPDIVLVEEPEMHLHPGLETSMMQYLKRVSKNTQVFLTTHSTNFLDTADMRNVYLVSKVKNTTVERVNFEEAEAQIPRELGLKLSSLFMFDRLVFVEGTTDEAILREWSSKIGINLSQTNVGFVPIGGSRNFLYFATEATLSFLRNRGVVMWFILDRDERDSSEVKKLKDSLGDRAKVHVLSKRELENYLVCPRGLHLFIRSKLIMSSRESEARALTVSQVVEKLAEVSEELKELAVQKRVARILNRPAYPRFTPSETSSSDDEVTDRISAEIALVTTSLEELKSRASDILKMERSAVDREWAQHKLDIVPGDELLDRTCKKFGVRFQKDRDGVRLASLVEVDEIPGEIKDILSDLVRPDIQGDI